MSEQTSKSVSIDPDDFILECHMIGEVNTGFRLLKIAAYHQAGHAVMAYINHEFLSSGVAISEEGTGLSTLQDRYWTRQREQRSQRQRLRRNFNRPEIYSDICISLAGPTAELLFLHRNVCLESLFDSPDVESVLRKLREMYRKHRIGRGLPEYLLRSFFLPRTVDVLSSPRVWKAVREIARQLIKHRKLSGDLIEQICSRTGVARFNKSLPSSGAAKGAPNPTT
jgi:hypothetical protein